MLWQLPIIGILAGRKLNGRATPVHSLERPSRRSRGPARGEQDKQRSEGWSGDDTQGEDEAIGGGGRSLMGKYRSTLKVISLGTL